MKLELKHLAPYLPYGLKVIKVNRDNEIIILNQLKHFPATGNNAFYINDVYVHQGNYKPILRPLSDLTKEIEHDGEKFVPREWFESSNCPDEHEQFLACLSDPSIPNHYMSYRITQKFFEWHFDVFGLIPAGLAIEKS